MSWYDDEPDNSPVYAICPNDDGEGNQCGEKNQIDDMGNYDPDEQVTCEACGHKWVAKTGAITFWRDYDHDDY